MIFIIKVKNEQDVNDSVDKEKTKENQNKVKAKLNKQNVLKTYEVFENKKFKSSQKKQSKKKVKHN